MKYLRKKKNIAHKILTEIWDILPTELKRIVSPTLFKKKKKKKKKFVNEPQRIVHVVYVKHMSKTLDFCKLSVSTYIAL